MNRLPSVLLAALVGFQTLAFAQAALPPQAAPAQGLATIRPGDIFEMRLGGVPPEFAQDFNSQFTVSQEGSVNLPLLKEVRAVGLTPPQLERAIQSRLVAERYFSNPAVNINLVQNIRFISIGGGVRQPQRMQWTPDLTLMSAIQIAGGLTDFATYKGIRLIREKQTQLFDGRQLERDPAKDPRLLPGDQVIVRQ
ncbi:MAG TPA: polysaccharide biosynthesis/export family protein [Chthoniobacteraceae bacterium]|jgi:polysaccharide export outer membrane protein